MSDGELVLIDGIHTADSSRCWQAATFEERFAAGPHQDMYDNENIWQWLIGQGSMGDGPIPPLPDAIRFDLAEVYCKLHERLLGRPLVPPARSAADTLYDAPGL